MKCKNAKIKKTKTIHPFTHSTQKYRLKLTKTGILRYFSHLDWQNTFLKALARSGLNVAFSQGFNPSMKVSLGVALPLFIQSECELVDIEIYEEPIISLTGKELGGFNNEKDLRKAAIDYYKKNIQGKTVEHPVLGKIEFTKIGLKKTVFTSANIKKMQILFKLQEIIKHAAFECTYLSYKINSKFDKYHYLTGKTKINEEIFQYRITIGEDTRGKKYYNLNDIKYSSPTLTGLQNSGANELKKDLLMVTGKQIPGINKSINIIAHSDTNFNPAEELEIKNLQLKLEKVLPEGCKILKIEKLNTGAKAIDNTVQWAEYEIKLFDDTLHNFKSLMYNMKEVLSSDEILLTKKNKKGILKTTNVKPSIKSYDFRDKSLFIVLKAGQGGETPALRADDLMQIIASDTLFDIKRINFFDENVKVI